MVDHICPEFSQLITRMMAKKMDQRPQSVAELLEELGQHRILKAGLGNVTR